MHFGAPQETKRMLAGINKYRVSVNPDDGTRIRCGKDRVFRVSSL